jgi:CRISPR-associated endonuclease/helicase Cas3
VGKGSCAWQQGLEVAERTGSRVGLDHKLAGAWLAQGAGAGPFAVCVDGHHGGMRAAADLKNILRSATPELLSGWEETTARVTQVVPELKAAGALIPSWLAAERAGRSAAPDMLARMLFSALVDADFLDTEAHFRGRRRFAGDADIGELAARFEERRAALLAGRRPSPADGWREEVYAQAVTAAAGPCGLYRMAAPTGSGKTLSSGAFALHHAAAHGLRRVVVAVPFISITEQNADVYRGMLDQPGQRVVLEHHSGAELDDGDDPGSWWRKLAAENWDAPFVVTTTVQLLQSLFDHRPAAMRKLHRLARSVIVLDEVQALPDRLLLPILSALRLLTERFGATVVLASATQPAYWSLEPLRELPARDIIADPQPLYDRFRRVRYHWQLDPQPTLAHIAAEVASEPQVLIVVNTTRDSAALHRELVGLRPPSFGQCLHMSTRMTVQHRREVLSQIRELLDAGKPVAVVATQLIEAGVDVDFPVVYRA